MHGSHRSRCASGQGSPPISAGASASLSPFTVNSRLSSPRQPRRTVSLVGAGGVAALASGTNAQSGGSFSPSASAWRGASADKGVPHIATHPGYESAAA